MKHEIITCNTKENIDYAIEFLTNCYLIANDVETWPEIQLMSMNGYAGINAKGKVKAFVFPFTEERSPYSEPPDTWEYAYKAMRRINMSGIPFTYHNASYDLFWLTRFRLPVKTFAYDTMAMWWALYPELPKDLGFLSSVLNDSHRYWKGGGKTTKQSDYIRYNALDNIGTLKLTLKLIALLNNDKKAKRNWVDARRRIISCLEMSMWGLRVDENALTQLKNQLEEKASNAKKRLQYLVADDSFNFRSPKQVKVLFYDLLGATPRNAKGRIIANKSAGTTGAIVRKYIAREGVIQKRIIDAIENATAPAKQISNVVNMPRKWGRVYTSYNAIGTTTSRLASSKSPINIGSNLQNIRKQYRHWIVPDNNDSIFLEIDFSAADDVFVSFESSDENKIKLFRSGKDAHATNVALLFKNWSYDAVIEGKKRKDPKIVHPIYGIRQGMKKVAHGCNYLMAKTTLLQSIGIEAIKAAAKEYGVTVNTYAEQVEFCGELAMRYRSHYNRLSNPDTEGSWYNDLKEEVKTTGGFMTPFNYFQRFLSDPESHEVLRAVAATAGQAGTAGRINMAMDELVHGYIMPEFRDAPNPAYGIKHPRRVDHRMNGIRIVLQTHDSLTFHINRKNQNWVNGVLGILEVMQRPVIIKNKLTKELESFVIGIEVEAGHAWGKGLQEIDHKDTQNLITTLESL